MVEEGASQGEDHVKGAVLFCIEHATFTVVGENPAESVGAVERREVGVETGSGGLLLTVGEDIVGVLEDGGADGKKKR